MTKGLYDKYEIYKELPSFTKRLLYLLSRLLGGERVTGGYFVLKPGSDQAALAALRTYASKTANRVLAFDLRSWIRELEAKAQ